MIRGHGAVRIDASCSGGAATRGGGRVAAAPSFIDGARDAVASRGRLALETIAYASGGDVVAELLMHTVREAVELKTCEAKSL